MQKTLISNDPGCVLLQNGDVKFKDSIFTIIRLTLLCNKGPQNFEYRLSCYYKIKDTDAWTLKDLAFSCKDRLDENKFDKAAILNKYLIPYLKRVHIL